MTDTNETTIVHRRTVLGAIGAVTSGAIAGCSSGDGENTSANSDGEESNTVAVGPNGGLVFEPADITVSAGETVTWTFESPSHNVSGWPGMSAEISIPDGAAGFGTMEEGGDGFAVVADGETFQHTFDTAGEYTYVCIPHATSGMVGTVTVEE